MREVFVVCLFHCAFSSTNSEEETYGRINDRLQGEPKLVMIMKKETISEGGKEK